MKSPVRLFYLLSYGFISPDIIYLPLCAITVPKSNTQKKAIKNFAKRRSIIQQPRSIANTICNIKIAMLLNVFIGLKLITFFFNP